MTRFNIRKLLPLILFVFAIVAFFAYQKANATNPPKSEPSQLQQQQQQQQQWQNQESSQHQSNEALSESIANSDAAASASNDGNSLSVNSAYERGPAEVVLVPHNNTANCQRVYGLGGGNTSGNIVLGFPFRDKTCDLEAAADDAFAQGNIELGWVFKCKQKNLQKAFGSKNNWRKDGEQLCLGSATNVMQMHDRIRMLETQKQTLLEERKFDHERCNEEKTRIVEGCTYK